MDGTTAIKAAVLDIATKDKAAVETATNSKAKPSAAVDNNAFDAIITVNTFVDKLRKKKTSWLALVDSGRPRWSPSLN